MDNLVGECVAVVRVAEKPLSIKEIREQLPKEKRFPEKQEKDIVSALRQLPESAGIVSWPNFGSQRNLFWNKSFAEAVRETLPQVLDDAPMTATQVMDALQKKVKKASPSGLKKEVPPQLRMLTAQSDLIQVGKHYCAPGYLRRVLRIDTQPADRGDGQLADLVVDAVRELETAQGNYVSIPDLRNSATFRKAIDSAILSAVRKGGLVLARYDGPAPLPGERPDLLDAGEGAFFVGMARAREGGAS